MAQEEAEAHLRAGAALYDATLLRAREHQWLYTSSQLLYFPQLYGELGLAVWSRASGPEERAEAERLVRLGRERLEELAPFSDVRHVINLRLSLDMYAADITPADDVAGDADQGPAGEGRETGGGGEEGNGEDGAW